MCKDVRNSYIVHKLGIQRVPYDIRNYAVMRVFGKMSWGYYAGLRFPKTGHPVTYIAAYIHPLHPYTTVSVDSVAKGRVVISATNSNYPRTNTQSPNLDVSKFNASIPLRNCTRDSMSIDSTLRYTTPPRSRNHTLIRLGVSSCSLHMTGSSLMA